MSRVRMDVWQAPGPSHHSRQDVDLANCVIVNADCAHGYSLHLATEHTHRSTEEAPATMQRNQRSTNADNDDQPHESMAQRITDTITSHLPGSHDSSKDKRESSESSSRGSGSYARGDDKPQGSSSSSFNPSRGVSSGPVDSYRTGGAGRGHDNDPNRYGSQQTSSYGSQSEKSGSSFGGPSSSGGGRSSNPDEYPSSGRQDQGGSSGASGATTKGYFGQQSGCAAGTDEGGSYGSSGSRGHHQHRHGGGGGCHHHGTE